MTSEENAVANNPNAEVKYRSGCFYRGVAFLACFVVWMGGACPAVAQEGPVPPDPESAPQDEPSVPPDPVSIPQEGPPVPVSPEPSPLEKLVEEKAPGVVMAVDKSHARFEQSILDRVIRFDNFFGSAKGEDARYPDHLIRWVNSLRMEKGGHFKYRTSARASFVLPRISKRLRLAVSAETENEPFSARLPEDPGNPGFDRTLEKTRLANSELRYSLIRKPSIDMFLGTGIRIKLPLETFVRSRVQYSHRLTDVTLRAIRRDRLLEEYRRVRGDLGVRTFAPVRPEDASSVGATRGRSPRKARGWNGHRNSPCCGSSPLGVRSPSWGASPAAPAPPFLWISTGSSTRYRRNFLRTWLFFELEPEVSSPRDPTWRVPFDLRLHVSNRSFVLWYDCHGEE